MKRYNERMDFVAHQMAGIIQNISQNRADKKITITDLVDAGKLAYLTVFPGNTVTPQECQIYPFGYHTFYTIFYVKGMDNNVAGVIWAISFAGDGGEEDHTWSSLNGRKNGVWYKLSYANYGEIDRMVTKFSKNVAPSQIHPNLVIQKDEVKIIVECSLLYCTERSFTDGRQCSQVPFQKVFGFYVISPKYVARNGNFYSFFNSVVIFTPKPGLFSETPPQ